MTNKKIYGKFKIAFNVQNDEFAYKFKFESYKL